MVDVVLTEPQLRALRDVADGHGARVDVLDRLEALGLIEWWKVNPTVETHLGPRVASYQRFVPSLTDAGRRALDRSEKGGAS